MSGYTLAGVAGRIREVEHKIGGGWYVSVCWLAMSRDSGKGAKRRLEDKVFGTDKPKVTSTFRNAWRIAEKSFAEGFHAGCRKDVAEMTLDDAIDFALKRLDAHKTALGVTSMGEYEAVCMYATKADIPAEASAEPTSEVPVAAASEPPVERDPMELAVSAMLALSAGELLEFASKVQARLIDLQATEELRMAA